MGSRSERNCQVRMSSSLWNRVGEIAQELGHKDARGRHSAMIREMVSTSAATWAYSPYVCRSSRHVAYVTAEGNVFHRHVQVIRLNASREKIPSFIEMKPEKYQYYQRKLNTSKDIEKTTWLKSQWLMNYFAIWNGKKEASDLVAFQQSPLDSAIDTEGINSKAADLSVDAISGRFLTREVVTGFRDYVEWKEPRTPVFDRIDIPTDIPTIDLEACVIIDQKLFDSLEIEGEEIANLSLEFRNRESAIFEGKDVALDSETRFEEQYGRSPDDDGSDEMLRQVRRLRQRLFAILETDITTDHKKVSSMFDREAIISSLRLPSEFLFYKLQWPSPHLGIKVCIRWEKPLPNHAMPRANERRGSG